MVRVVLLSIGLLSLAKVAHAEALGSGDQVKGFALKAVNADVIGEKMVAIDDYIGANATDPKKAVVLTFFATYCEPCKREIPFLAALHREYAAKGLSIMSVSIDKEDEKIAFMKSLAAEHQVKFPVLYDRFNIVAKRYAVEKLPLVYIINGEGRVVTVKTGYTEDASRTILDEVRRLVGVPTSDPIPPTISAHMSSFKRDSKLPPTPEPEPVAAAGRKKKTKNKKGRARRTRNRR